MIDNHKKFTEVFNKHLNRDKEAMISHENAISDDYKIKDINIDPAEVEKVRYYPPRELQSIMINEHDKMTNGLYNSLEIYFKTKNQKNT